MSAATLTTKGQLTLPKEVRAALGVGPGDRVEFVRMEDGNYAVMPATQSVKMLKGLMTFSLVCSVGAIANVGIAQYLFEHRQGWIPAAIGGILVGAVWNFATSSFYTWGKRA